MRVPPPRFPIAGRSWQISGVDFKKEISPSTFSLSVSQSVSQSYFLLVIFVLFFSGGGSRPRPRPIDYFRNSRGPTNRSRGFAYLLRLRLRHELPYVTLISNGRQSHRVGLRTYPDASGGYMFLLGGAGAQGDRFGHFGLGLTHYTHFTSPIRRYADIVVHRLLLAALGGSRAAPVAAAATASVAVSFPILEVFLIVTFLMYDDLVCSACFFVIYLFWRNE